MKKACSVIATIVFVLSFSGCEEFPGFKKGPSQSVSPAAPTGPVLVKVNDWVLTIGEFDKQIDILVSLNGGDANVPVGSLGILASTFLSAQVEKIDLGSVEGKTVYLELLINQELLAQEAKLQGLGKDRDVVKSVRKSEVEILGFTLLNNALKDIKVTPIEVEDLYNNDYKTTLESIERRKIREIVVNSEPKAKDILVQVLTGGNFAGLAQQHSLAETARAGGLVKYDGQEYLIPQQDLKFQKFWEIAFTLDKGVVSSVFKDPAKQEYYVIMVDDIQKGVPKSLNEVYNDLEYILLQGKSMEAIIGLMSRIKSKFAPALTVNNSLIK